MSTAQAIPKLADVSFEELKNWVIREMDDGEKALLSKESNVETLEQVIREHQGNSFLADADVPVVVTNILKRYHKNSLSGEITRYIFIGSRDFYGHAENASSQQALFLRLTEDMKIDDKGPDGKPQRATEEINIWGTTPNKKVSDKWEPGHSYDCAWSLSPNKDGKIDEKTGQVIMYKRIKNYRIFDNSRELLQKAILNFPSASDYFANFKNIDAELAKTIIPQFQYQPATFEFKVSEVSGIQLSERVLRGQNYEWNTPDNAPLQPVIKANSQNKPQILFNINGEAQAGKMKVVIYGSFNACDLAQYFVASTTIEKLLQNPAFLTETPQNQADVLGIALRDKQFRIVGSMQNIDFNAEGDTVFINVAGMALVEVPAA